MFRPNRSHDQTELFGYLAQLPSQKRQQLEASEEYQFYQLLFRQIPEADFVVLYSEEGSRPNAPVNTLVAALILLQKRGWTYRELFDHIDIDLKTRTALGLWDLEPRRSTRRRFSTFKPDWQTTGWRPGRTCWSGCSII